MTVVQRDAALIPFPEFSVPISLSALGEASQVADEIPPSAACEFVSRGVSSAHVDGGAIVVVTTAADAVVFRALLRRL